MVRSRCRWSCPITNAGCCGAGCASRRHIRPWCCGRGSCRRARRAYRTRRPRRISRETVRKWRSRFTADRLEGLVDRPRSGARRRITDGQVEALVVRTLDQAPPTGDSHWSTRSMARTAGMSQSAVSRIRRASHIVETWKLSTGPQFVTTVRDVVGIYLAPPENALVLAVDELDETRRRHPRHPHRIMHTN
ncbi:helix-turn-helix domain-containing protein [Streptomyces sp. NPDC001922]|uniref:helix-turn-helix domain-containing protein n=1 Tax=Streptomyces sp. NPDC001922 TaxID=3364624 RepID=UPI0036C44CEA